VSAAQPSPVNPQDFRRTVGRFTTGVTVVTTCKDDTLHGMTASSFASLSLDPLLVLVCVDRTAGMHELLPETGTFAVTILSADQAEASVWFASPRRPSGTDQFDGVEWERAPVTGCPVLKGGVAWLDCRVVSAHDGGDHTIFVGEVLDLGEGGGREPLVWYSGAYQRLRP
jgi:flavin reductase